eukprot:Hpha_TRINITY_DN27031_c0_g1::TRINITY_DN27031_c0_g1_i1::g.33205::m.33205
MPAPRRAGATLNSSIGSTSTQGQVSTKRQPPPSIVSPCPESESFNQSIRSDRTGDTLGGKLGLGTPIQPQISTERVTRQRSRERLPTSKAHSPKGRTRRGTSSPAMGMRITVSSPQLSVRTPGASSPVGRRRSKGMAHANKSAFETAPAEPEMEFLDVQSFGPSFAGQAASFTRLQSSQPSGGDRSGGSRSPKGFLQSYKTRTGAAGKEPGSLPLLGVVQMQHIDLKRLSEEKHSLAAELKEFQERYRANSESASELVTHVMSKLSRQPYESVLGRPVPDGQSAADAGCNVAGELRRYQEIMSFGERSQGSALLMAMTIAAVEGHVRESITWAAEAGAAALWRFSKRTEPTELHEMSFTLDDSSKEERRLRTLLARETAAREAAESELAVLRDVTPAPSARSEHDQEASLRQAKTAQVELQTEVSRLETVVYELTQRNEDLQAKGLAAKAEIKRLQKQTAGLGQLLTETASAEHNHAAGHAKAGNPEYARFADPVPTADRGSPPQRGAGRQASFSPADAKRSRGSSPPVPHRRSAVHRSKTVDLPERRPNPSRSPLGPARGQSPESVQRFLREVISRQSSSKQHVVLQHAVSRSPPPVQRSAARWMV